MAHSDFLDSLSKEQRQDLVHRLHKLQKGLCYISGELIDLQIHEIDLDHIIALTRGGRDDESNIGLALAHHNRSKGMRDLELQRRIYSFYRDLEQHSAATKNSTFTVGHVLEKARGKGLPVNVTWRDGKQINVAWSHPTDGPKTLQFDLTVDPEVSEDVQHSFFGRLPPAVIHHSDLNPRSIHDLEPMIEEFYQEHPQMQPSLAFFVPESPGATQGRIMLFDGQHKAAAQLYNRASALLCRVFLPKYPCTESDVREMIEELRRTNFRAHTKLAQLHFAQFTEDKVGHTLYGEMREQAIRVLQQQSSDTKEVSERHIHRQLKQTNPDDAADFRDYHHSFLRYEVLTNRENELMNFVETVSARSRRYPISYDTLKKLLDTFLCLDLTEEPLLDADKWRKIERENLATLLDLLANESLIDRFKLDIGVYKLEQKLEADPKSLPLDHLRAYRIYRKPALAVWSENLRDGISQYLTIRDKYSKGWHKERPLWAEVTDKEWAAIRKGIRAIVGHKLWAETQKDLVGALASTRQKDWESILLEGKLPGRAEKLYPELSVAMILRAMTEG